MQSVQSLFTKYSFHRSIEIKSTLVRSRDTPCTCKHAHQPIKAVESMVPAHVLVVFVAAAFLATQAFCAGPLTPGLSDGWLRVSLVVIFCLHALLNCSIELQT
jgi:hypothetical protein